MTQTAAARALVREATPREIAAWDELVTQFTNHRLVHRAAWIRSLERSGVGQRGMTRRFASSFRYRERVYFHAASRQPAAYGGSAALVNCRAKIAATPRRLLPRPTEQPKRKEFLWLI